MKVNVCRKGGFLIPATDEDQINFAKIKQGEVYSFEFKKVRNLQFHRKYFAMLRIAWVNLPEQYEALWTNEIQFRYALEEIAGVIEPYATVDGEIKYKVKSISFETMDNNEFNDVYNSVRSVILATVLKGCDENVLEYLESQF